MRLPIVSSIKLKKNVLLCHYNTHDTNCNCFCCSRCRLYTLLTIFIFILSYNEMISKLLKSYYTFRKLF